MNGNAADPGVARVKRAGDIDVVVHQNGNRSDGAVSKINVGTRFPGCEDKSSLVVQRGIWIESLHRTGRQRRGINGNLILAGGEIVELVIAIASRDLRRHIHHRPVPNCHPFPPRSIAP